MQTQSITETRGRFLRALTFSNPVQLLGVMALGFVIVFGTGFLNTDAVHNAAHDTRHAEGFPCH